MIETRYCACMKNEGVRLLKKYDTSPDSKVILSLTLKKCKHSRLNIEHA